MSGVPRPDEPVFDERDFQRMLDEDSMKARGKRPDGIIAAFSEAMGMGRDGDHAGVGRDKRFERLNALGDEGEKRFLGGKILVIFPSGDEV